MRLATLLLALSSASAFVTPTRQLQRQQQQLQQQLQQQTHAVGSIHSTSLSAVTESATLTEMDLPEKLYSKKTKEAPKVLGGLKIGLRELVVITGASSGLGLATAVSLAKTGKYFVVMAVRDVEKAKRGKYSALSACVCVCVCGMTREGFLKLSSFVLYIVFSWFLFFSTQSPRNEACPKVPTSP